MKTRVVLVALGMILLATMSLAATTSEASLIFFVRQDMRNQVNTLHFEEGFLNLAHSLPADTPIELVFFSGEKYATAYSGPAGSFTWDPQKFQFTLPNNGTMPYRALLKFLKDRQIHDGSIAFISRVERVDVSAYYDSYGFFSRKSMFNPQNCPPLVQLIDYCKKNTIKLNGFLIPPLAVDTTEDNGLGFLMGSLHAKTYNVISFEDAFKNYLKNR